jgi:hypothetical protein
MPKAHVSATPATRPLSGVKLSIDERDELRDPRQREARGLATVAVYGTTHEGMPFRGKSAPGPPGGSRLRDDTALPNGVQDATQRQNGVATVEGHVAPFARWVGNLGAQVADVAHEGVKESLSSDGRKEGRGGRPGFVHHQRNLAPSLLGALRPLPKTTSNLSGQTIAQLASEHDNLPAMMTFMRDEIG